MEEEKNIVERIEKDFEKYLTILGDRPVYSIFCGKQEWDEGKKTYTISSSSSKVTEWVEKRALTERLRNYINMNWVVWVSLNEKETGQDTIEGVKRIHTFWFDFDSARQDKSKRASQKELEEALKEAKRFKNIQEKKGLRGFLACSGNGYHVFFPVHPYDLRGGSRFKKDFNQKQGVFYRRLRKKNQFKFDTATDIRRVTQPIGYPNMKIPNNPIPTYWMDNFELEDIKKAREYNEQLIKNILDTEIKKTPGIKSLGRMRLNFDELLTADNHLRALYNGNIELTYNKDVEECRQIRQDTGRELYTSRSEAEQAFVTLLCRKGFSDSEIREIMSRCRIGKWQEKGGSYHDITVMKARVFASELDYEERDKRRFKKRKWELEKEFMGIIIKNLMNRYIFVTSDDTEEIYIYDHGIYEPGEIKIKTEIEDVLGNDVTKTFINEIMGHLQRRTFVSRNLFNTDYELLPVRNGLLNLNTHELQDFDPSKIFTYQLQVNFDPEASCPNIEAFIQSIVSSEDIPVVQEYLGYCLYPDMPAHKSFWLYGTGRNGKTTFVNLIKALLGDICTTSVGLDELGPYHRFSKARLYGKLLNIIPEPTLRQMQTIDFKRLIGGDPISAEIKNVQKPIDFVNFAKFIIYGNRFPEVHDDSFAFWERIIIIKFPNIFRENAVPNYDKVLIGQDGLSGFLNWCLEGLKRLKTQGFHFTTSKESESVKCEFMKQSNTVRAFISEECIVNPTAYIPKDMLYEEYKKYCEKEELKIEGKKELTQAVDEIPSVYAKNKKIGGRIKNTWFGIRTRSKGVGELKKRGKTLDMVPLSVEENMEEHRPEYTDKNDPIHIFAEECLEEETNSYETKDEVYSQYVQFCNERKLSPVEKRVFGKHLPRYIKTESSQRRDKQHNRVYCWINIREKDQEKTDQELVKLDSSVNSSCVCGIEFQSQKDLTEHRKWCEEFHQLQAQEARERM